MNLKNYDTVWFDAFWTLVEGSNSTDRYQHTLIKKYGWDMRKAQLLISPYPQTPEEYFKEVFPASWVSYGQISDEEKKQLLKYYEEDYNNYKLFERTEELLETVKSQVDHIFLISNLSSLYIPVIEKLWLTNYFNFIIYSCDFWAKKSVNSTDIFDWAYERINSNIPRNKILYTGDKEGNDQVAPKKAWFDAVGIEEFRKIILE
jgi:FMN phosphatase YigB (HAD superfamily)